MPGPLLVVDAPSLLYRAFYGLPTTITGTGDQPVNALLGSVNMIWREADEHDPRAVVCCFGPDAAPYRTELYPGYHAERPPMPDELAPQWQQAPSLYAALGWHCDRRDDLEADDLLGSYAIAEREAGGGTLIMTGDRDMYQCADDVTTVLYVKTGSRGAEVVDAAEVERRYGVTPTQVPDFIALRGDPSDGLPGAKGIGEKTAASLLQRHGSLEGVLAVRDEQTPRIAGSLGDSASVLADFKEIATLRTVGVTVPPDRGLDRAQGAETARALGMNGLAERLETAG
ncbi:MAG: 5'-3' exonuclease [Solirubrobacterales bacterium]